MDDNAIQNQQASTINRKRKSLIDEGTVHKSRAEIGNKSKYIRDANGNIQSKSVIVGSVPPNTSCLYYTVNSFKFMNTTLKLVKCAHKGCENKLHHMCQKGYASAGGLKELYNVPEKNYAPNMWETSKILLCWTG